MCQRQVLGQLSLTLSDNNNNNNNRDKEKKILAADLEQIFLDNMPSFISSDNDDNDNTENQSYLDNV